MLREAVAAPFNRTPRSHRKFQKTPNASGKFSQARVLVNPLSVP